ncbi:perakine reductase-like [Camellia sinensis]|uniref:perakine reductase-like n=1 Tax=Camellia sinensis TaxID=4442 RepID=UPI0010362D60|nr:perakine reductase-like [Camellia sinensis]
MEKVMPAVVNVMKEEATLVTLIKPQFEVPRSQALKDLPRENVQLTTKFGIVKMEPTQVVVKDTVEYVNSCCEASLKHLGVDYIDRYYVHRIDTSVPIEETMRELMKLVEEGKIKYIGLSEASPNTIRRAHVVHSIIALQMEYSFLTQEIEEEIIPLLHVNVIYILGYFEGVTNNDVEKVVMEKKLILLNKRPGNTSSGSAA